MFLPLHKRPDWRNPPLVTLALILVLVAVHAVAQKNDREFENTAYRYYFTSGLAMQEIPAYIRFLRQRGLQERAEKLVAAIKLDRKRGLYGAFQLMQGDGRFLEALTASRIITPQNPNYAQWQAQRTRFEDLLSHSLAWRLGLKPYDVKPLALVTHIFLHADYWHLGVNLLFLFMFGFTLEYLIGRFKLLLLFLLAGVLSGAAYVLLEPESARWGIGASGAIGGLAGAYAIVFGMRKINLFYTLVFYFDRIRLPAIVLLPIWLAYELIDFVVLKNSINNIAHMAGLISGAFMGMAFKSGEKLDTDYLDAEQKQREYHRAVGRARQYLSNMEFTLAHEQLLELNQQYPDDREILHLLFGLSKLDEFATEIHRWAETIFRLDGNDPLTSRFVHSVFMEYLKIVGKLTHIGVDTRLRLLRRLAGIDALDSAETVLNEITSDRDMAAQVPTCLLVVINAAEKRGHRERAARLREQLLSHFPDSEEARLLGNMKQPV
ncbi:MAG TPA: rhomboid family intramembrane serine protease [Gammaproteobacteria bacterium]|nr:rhomboid family intramembrane serine protease [Gammaproteobacteria bacterium]